MVQKSMFYVAWCSNSLSFEILVNEMVYITFTNVEARVNQKVVWGKLSFI